ncbi:SH3 domain-containing protein [Eikenella sp. S3360]|uniref:SH3 domain-containing protein n=1 Tax=Eikenella glucosivorans TaxID=2766967 RepID=A0ABS0NA84_9NEIS|nr:SH3 domain-containing protein [Eikenella glucosivorans]MBH5329185.1 SH3 domain-containing protein [Eikenella glucosivorans]
MISSPAIRAAAFSVMLLALSATAAARAKPGVCNLPEPAEPTTYLVTDGDERVNIRARPNTRAAVLAVFDNFGETDILGKSGAWYRVRLVVRGRPMSGYVHQSQVSLRRIYTSYSNDGTIIQRSKPNNHSEEEQRIPNCKLVIEYPANRKGNWLYVEVPGTDGSLFGYVHKSQLRPRAEW